MNGYYFSEGASESQIGAAAGMRYSIGGLSQNDRVFLHQIVHSADTYGPYSQTYNPFRDHSKTFDPSAQAKLDAIAARYRYQ